MIDFPVEGVCRNMNSFVSARYRRRVVVRGSNCVCVRITVPSEGKAAEKFLPTSNPRGHAAIKRASVFDYPKNSLGVTATS